MDGSCFPVCPPHEEQQGEHIKTSALQNPMGTRLLLAKKFGFEEAGAYIRNLICSFTHPDQRARERNLRQITQMLPILTTHPVYHKQASANGAFIRRKESSA